MDWMYAYLVVAGIVMLATEWVAGRRLLDNEEFRDSPGLFGVTVASIGILAGFFWPVTMAAALVCALVVRFKVHRNK